MVEVVQVVLQELIVGMIIIVNGYGHGLMIVVAAAVIVAVTVAVVIAVVIAAVAVTAVVVTVTVTVAAAIVIAVVVAVVAAVVVVAAKDQVKEVKERNMVVVGHNLAIENFDFCFFLFLFFFVIHFYENF